MAKLRTVLFAGAAGATTAYFLDPSLGRSRRADARERLLGVLHRGERRAEQAGRRIAADAADLRERVSAPLVADTAPTGATIKASDAAEADSPPTGITVE